MYMTNFTLIIVNLLELLKRRVCSTFLGFELHFLKLEKFQVFKFMRYKYLLKHQYCFKLKEK